MEFPVCLCFRIICRLFLSVFLVSWCCVFFYAAVCFPMYLLSDCVCCVCVSAFIICCVFTYSSFILFCCFFLRLLNSLNLFTTKRKKRFFLCLYLHGCCVCFITLFVGFWMAMFSFCFLSIYLCVCLLCAYHCHQEKKVPFHSIHSHVIKNRAATFSPFITFIHKLHLYICIWTLHFQTPTQTPNTYNNKAAPIAKTAPIPRASRALNVPTAPEVPPLLAPDEVEEPEEEVLLEPEPVDLVGTVPAVPSAMAPPGRFMVAFERALKEATVDKSGWLLEEPNVKLGGF